MRNQKTPVGFSPRDGQQGAEVRRRIADCRERLRRERAARRINARATSSADIFTAEEPEMAVASVMSVGRGKKT
jgi:hypothetical protein